MDIARIIDLEKLKSLLDSFGQSAGMSAGLVDLAGRVLIESNWRKVCTDFHRRRPDCLKGCLESDTILARRLVGGEKSVVYTCPNGLTNCASAVIINGEHVASLFVGQFMTRPPDLAAFRKQAARHGFDETAYLAALARVPVLSRETVENGLKFLLNLTEFLGTMGAINLGAQEKAEHLAESEARWRSLVENNPDLVVTIDREGKVLDLNREPSESKAPGGVGQPVWELFSDVCRWDLEAAVRQVFQTGEAMNLEISRPAPSGAPARYLARLGPVWTAAGIGSLVLIARDVSPLKEKQAELAAYQDRLESLVAERTESLDKARKAALSLKEDADAQRQRAEETMIELQRFRVNLEEMVRERTAKLEFEIQERKKAEEELRLSEAKFSQAFHASPAALLITRAEDGRILEANESFCRMFGVGPDDLWAHSVEELDLWSSPAVYRELLEAVKAQGAVYDSEVELKRKSGEVFWAAHSMEAITLREEPCLLSTVLDIDDRRRADEALRESEERFRVLFEFAPDAYYLNDLNGVLVDGNKKAEELTGFQREELAGKNFFELSLLSPEEMPRLRPLLERNAQGLPTGPDEFALVRKDGARAVAEIITYPVTIHNQPLVLGMARDITDRKRAEAELQKHRETLEQEVRRRTEDLDRSRRAALSLMQDANIQRQRAEKALEELARSEHELILAKEEAESADRAKSAFLATMSHEIRTPLNAMVGLTYLLLKTGLTPRQTDYLRKMLGASTSLRKLIEDTLDLSKIEAGRLEMEAVDFSLDSVLEEVASVVEAQAQGKGLRLEVRTDPGMPRLLHGDPLRLGQVLRNLVDNAVKFTHAGGVTVSIRLESREDSRVVLGFSVKDTGIGLTETQMGRLFQPFTQADVTTSRKYGGSGLGLAISKRLVELMNGQISVRSQPGQGSEFAFAVPLDLAHAPDRRLTEEKPPPGTGLRALAGTRVLLVEDNEINREVGREILESEGLIVDLAENGKQALRKVRPGKYDAVLMDIKMPVMDGVEAARAIRRSKRLNDLPILAMTADVMAGDLDAYREAGINDSISKPIDPLKLFHTLARWIKPGLPAAQGVPPSGSEAPPAGGAESLGPLTGIDIRAGLARLSGNVGLYRKLLLKFRDRHRDAGAAIAEAVAARDLRQARALAHTLKGVSGNLGAQELYRASTDLDRALRRESPEGLGTMTAAVSGSLAEVMHSIARLEESRPVEAGRLAPPGTGSVPAVFRKLAALLEWGDLEAADLLTELKALWTEANDETWLRSFAGEIEHFRFEEALRLLTDKARELNIPLGGEGGQEG
jgi:two-component system sensor histidine kinase/response regulator